MVVKKHLTHIQHNYVSQYKKLHFKNNITSELLWTFNKTSKKQKKCIYHKGIQYQFVTPNHICKYRADTFSSKEPETLEWVDSFAEKSIFWDIGANVGIYSIYAARTKKCSVYAFEPSVFNLEILAKNINLNNQTDKISIIPVAISDKSGFGKLNMSNTEWGGALSTFNKPYGYDGNILNKIFEYSLLAMSMDDASGKFKIPSPDYIKIDVDGIEHLILLGGSEVLTDVKSLLIEVSIKFKEQKNNSQEYLKKAGLTLVRGFINGTTEDTVNQIWIRR